MKLNSALVFGILAGFTASEAAALTAVLTFSQASAKTPRVPVTTVTQIKNPRLVLNAHANVLYDVKANGKGPSGSEVWKKFEKDKDGKVVGVSNTLGIKTANAHTAAGKSNAWVDATGLGLLPDAKNNGFRYTATVSGDGAIMPNPGVKPALLSYSGRVSVGDPFALAFEDLIAEGIDPLNLDILVPMSITSLDFGGMLGAVPRVEMFFAESYLITDTGMATGLRLDVDHQSGVVVSGGTGVTHYLTDETYVVDTSVDTPMSLPDIQALIQSSLGADGVLDAPLHFGSMFSQQSLSTDISGDGSGVGAYAGGEGGVGTGHAEIGFTPVPLPASVLSYGTVLALSFAFVGRARRRSESGRNRSA